MTHRVVVTGMGAVSPLALTAQESWEAAVNGRSGVGPITLFDASDFLVQIAAEVKGFDPDLYMDPKEARRRDRFEQLATVAAQEALNDSGLEITEENCFRIGVVISSAIGGITSLSEQVNVINEKGPRRLNPFGIPQIMSNGAAGIVGIDIGARGPSFSVASACASSSDGIGVAMWLIRIGMCDAVLAGGAEATITPIGVGAFDRVGAMSRRNDNPPITPSPFSKDRDGLVMGEGSAVLTLESLEHARKRGARILAELVGYAATADAFHITAPAEDGSGGARAMLLALEDAHLPIDDVDYINAHGTGTQLNDLAETIAIKRALGQRAYHVPISSTKGATGHMMGTTGALEAIFCMRAILDSVIPPTINYREPDPECDLDYVPNQAREMPVRVAMSNSFGFGGHNAVLVLKAFED
jgi:3-oxoacyl-[acyl-carrier-protein] synthase II